MLKVKLTTILVGLICLNSISGFSLVLCHGSDGHIAIESIFHQHCKYHESEERDNHYESAVFMVDSLSVHVHCNDYKVSSDVFLKTQKSIKSISDEIITTDFITREILANNPFICNNSMANIYQTFSFHDPLRTIVLIA